MRILRFVILPVILSYDYAEYGAGIDAGAYFPKKLNDIDSPQGFPDPIGIPMETQDRNFDTNNDPNNGGPQISPPNGENNDLNGDFGDNGEGDEESGALSYLTNLYSNESENLGQFCIHDSEDFPTLKTARHFYKISKDAKLADLLWHQNFKSFTGLDLISIGISLVRDAKESWCDDIQEFVKGISSITRENSDQGEQNPQISEPQNLQDVDRRKRRETSNENPEENLVEIISGLVKLIVKILDDLNVPDSVQKLKNFVSQISYYLVDETDLEREDKPVEMFADFFSNSTADPELVELISEVIKLFDLNNVEARSDENTVRDTCKVYIKFVEIYYKQYESTINGVERIYGKYFNSFYEDYDSIGLGVSSVYSLSRHILMDQAACSNLVDSFVEKAKEGYTEFQTKLSDKAEAGNHNEQISIPVDDVMDVIDNLKEDIAFLFHDFLAMDTTQPLEQNAMSAWIYFTGRAEIFFSLLPEMYYFIHRQLREDPLVGSVIHFIDTQEIDFREIGRRQGKVANFVGEVGICGNDHLIFSQNGTEEEPCPQMAEFRQRFPPANLHSNAIMMSSVLALIFGLLFLH